ALASLDEIWAGEGDDDGTGGVRFGEMIEDSASEDPSLTVESDEVRRLLADAIDQLPERERLVVALYYYEELTLREIGEVLGVSESRVSQIHTKALLRLRAKLGRLQPSSVR